MRKKTQCRIFTRIYLRNEKDFFIGKLRSSRVLPVIKFYANCGFNDQEIYGENKYREETFEINQWRVKFPPLFSEEARAQQWDINVIIKL